MVSKYQAPEPEPQTHPRFAPPNPPGDGYAERLVYEALRQAFELTPWHKAVTLHIHREDFAAVTYAVAAVAGPELGKRVYVNPVQKRLAKRIMIDPRAGIEYRKGTPPWGERPAPEVDLSEPPVATIGSPDLCPLCGLLADGPGLVFTDRTICVGPDCTLHSRPDPDYATSRTDPEEHREEIRETISRADGIE